MTQRARTVLSAVLTSLALLGAPCLVNAQKAIDEESPWPRVRSLNGNTITLHMPEVERWTSNSFTARAAVEVALTESKTPLLGAIWFDAHGSVNHSNRVVTLDRFEVTKARFPTTSDNGSNALAAVRELIPAGARTVSLDYLITSLGFAQAAARQGAGGLKHTPPNIIWVTNRTVLVVIDGTPVLRPVPNSKLQRIVNTPVLLVKDPSANRFYLSGEGRWFAADSLDGPWALMQTLPTELTALQSRPSEANPLGTEEELPRIILSTTPAELLVTRDLPDFQPIRGTSLQYAADSDSQLFFHTKEREAYLLLSGRWFKASSLRGPWSYVAPHDLPSDFAKIPPNSPQGIVLASVPNTPQADLALLANSVPTTATMDRKALSVNPVYDGEPQFKPIEGTSMTYAINGDLPVIKSDDAFYTVENGVWFHATAAKGPWEVASTVPEEIYTIPPSSPLYYVTFTRIYSASEDEVEVGYSPGYQGAYEDDGTVVYGTGWDYQPWYGDEYYGWGWTWGYSYTYVPWYQWWVWRPWWTPAGGLRAAIIDNIYDRWQQGNHVSHYSGSAGRVPSAPSAESAPSAPSAASAASAASAERSASADRAASAKRAASAARAESAESAPAAQRGATSGSGGYPALYGRFRGSAGASAMSPPANTLALNPYLRPKSSARSGDIPNGAQLLSAVRQAPGGGRDLYASPDGNVYRRKNDGWYRRETSGGWSFYAPTQGRIEAGQVASARGAERGSAGIVYRPVAQTGAAARRDAGVSRVPNSGMLPRAQEVAGLERQYYARTLAQLRSQNWRANVNASRPGRTGSRRR
ncbi:MAG TPA: hypothetical protein VL361_18825 [Candidatus Limnocylindrales bacterium]|nr:hypothetical protein [Candidatus Limnocylindrales bacterium]